MGFYHNFSNDYNLNNTLHRSYRFLKKVLHEKHRKSLNRVYFFLNQLLRSNNLEIAQLQLIIE